MLFDLAGGAPWRRMLAVAAFTVAALLPPVSALARVDDQAATERAKTVLAQVQAGKLDRTLLAPSLDADLTDPILALMTQQVARLGMPARFGLRYETQNQGVTTYVFRVRWKDAVLDYTFGLDDATGTIRVLYFRAGPPE